MHLFGEVMIEPYVYPITVDMKAPESMRLRMNVLEDKPVTVSEY